MKDDEMVLFHIGVSFVVVIITEVLILFELLPYINYLFGLMMFGLFSMVIYPIALLLALVWYAAITLKNFIKHFKNKPKTG